MIVCCERCHGEMRNLLWASQWHSYVYRCPLCKLIHFEPKLSSPPTEATNNEEER